MVPVWRFGFFLGGAVIERAFVGDVGASIAVVHTVFDVTYYSALWATCNTKSTTGDRKPTLRWCFDITHGWYKGYLASRSSETTFIPAVHITMCA